MFLRRVKVIADTMIVNIEREVIKDLLVNKVLKCLLKLWETTTLIRLALLVLVLLVLRAFLILCFFMIRMMRKDNNPSTRAVDNMMAMVDIMPPILSPILSRPVLGTAGDGSTTLMVKLFVFIKRTLLFV